MVLKNVTLVFIVRIIDVWWGSGLGVGGAVGAFSVCYV